jgi:hypothetical protein
MKINHIYLLFGIFIIILLSSCLGGCYREGLATSERKDHKENKEDAIRQFKENNDSVQMMPPEDDVNNNNGLIGPGGEQWIFGPGGEQQRQPRQPGESEGEYIDQIHDEYVNNYNKDVSNNDEDEERENRHRRRDRSSPHYNPNGIPRSQIPKGDEDLYILKSQVVPPVCPACPPVISCLQEKEKCAPCPPCGRCPEPAFECRKVPNYNSNDEDFLPRPVLNNFSQFGM